MMVRYTNCNALGHHNSWDILFWANREFTWFFFFSFPPPSTICLMLYTTPSLTYQSWQALHWNNFSFPDQLIATTEDLLYLSMEQLCAVVPQVGIRNKIWCRLRPGLLKAAGLLDEVSLSTCYSMLIIRSRWNYALQCTGSPMVLKLFRYW